MEAKHPSFIVVKDWKSKFTKTSPNQLSPARASLAQQSPADMKKPHN